jgi:signal peptide peptidase SppA
MTTNHDPSELGDVLAAACGGQEETLADLHRLDASILEDRAAFDAFRNAPSLLGEACGSVLGSALSGERTAAVRLRPTRVQCPRIVEAMLGTPWAVEADKLAAIAEFISIRAIMAQPIAPEALQAFSDRSPRSGPAVRDSVAVLPVQGLLAHRLNLMSAMSGGSSTAQIGRDLDALAADPSVSAIILDIDSPGGTLAGTPELGAKIAAARANKPIIAVANSRAASAAYWLASQASEIVVTPSGEVGSIGVVGMHKDMSKALEAEGVAHTLISAGKFKTEGNPFGPLSEEARAAFQASIDDAYNQFVAAVASGRKVDEATVRDGFGQGRMVSAKQAVRQGMADRVATLDETIQRMLSARSRSNALKRSAMEFRLQALR